MSIANCVRCHRMFHKTPGVKVCQDCLQAEEAAFLQVRDFLEAQPETDMDALLAQTGLERAEVVRLVRAGRFGTLEETVKRLGVECRQCGEPVVRGQHCPVCTEELGQAFKDSAASLKPQPRSAPNQRRI